MRHARLEELSEARQSVVTRVKAAEKERDGLEGAKAVAEAYLSKERECTLTQSTIFQIFIRDGQVPCSAMVLHIQSLYGLHMQSSWVQVMRMTNLLSSCP